MTILTMLYLIAMFAILFITIFKIQNIILGLLLGNSTWIILFLLYYLNNPPLGRDERDLEFIYPVLIVATIFTVIRLVKYQIHLKRERKLSELEKMKIMDM